MKVLDRDGQALMPWGTPKTTTGPGAEIVDGDDRAAGEELPIAEVPIEEVAFDDDLPEDLLAPEEDPENGTATDREQHEIDDLPADE